MQFFTCSIRTSRTKERFKNHQIEISLWTTCVKEFTMAPIKSIICSNWPLWFINQPFTNLQNLQDISYHKLVFSEKMTLMYLLWKQVWLHEPILLIHLKYETVAYLRIWVPTSLLRKLLIIYCLLLYQFLYSSMKKHFLWSTVMFLCNMRIHAYISSKKLRN